MVPRYIVMSKTSSKITSKNIILASICDAY